MHFKWLTNTNVSAHLICILCEERTIIIILYTNTVVFLFVQMIKQRPWEGQCLALFTGLGREAVDMDLCWATHGSSVWPPILQRFGIVSSDLQAKIPEQNFISCSCHSIAWPSDSCLQDFTHECDKERLLSVWKGPSVLTWIWRPWYLEGPLQRIFSLQSLAGGCQEMWLVDSCWSNGP